MRPLVGRKSVVSILMVVVLPAPFGPQESKYFSLRDLEADVLDGSEIAERFDQIADGNHSRISSFRSFPTLQY